MIQVFIVIFLFISAHFFESINAESSRLSKNRYIAFALIILGLLSSLRHYGVGADTYTYKYIFDSDLSMTWDYVFNNFYSVYIRGEGKDAGYKLLTKCFQLFTTEYRLFLFFVSFVYNYALYNFLKNNTISIREAMLGLMIFVALLWSFTMAGIRQTLSMALCLYSFELIKRRKLLFFMMLMIVAASIHKSSLIFIPFYFIVRINPKLIYRSIAILLPVTAFYLSTIAQFVSNIIGDDDLTGYVVENRANSGTPAFTFMMVLIFVVGLLRLKYLLKLKNNIMFVDAYAFAVILVLFSWVDSTLIRLSMFYSIYMIVFIPRIIDSFYLTTKRKQQLYICIILMLCVLLLFQSQTLNYKFMWQEMLLPEKWR